MYSTAIIIHAIIVESTERCQLVTENTVSYVI
jgi:hypothetical protein